MKRFLATVLVVLMAFSLVACGSNAQQSASAPAANTAADANTGAEDAVAYDTVKVSIGTTGAAEDISTKAMEYMAEYLSNKTGGAMTIDLFPASQLGNAGDLIEMVGQGSLDIMLEGNFMTSYGVDDAKAGSVLFLNRSREMYRALNESDLKADWCQQFLDKNGIRILNGNFYRNGTAYVSNVKIETPEDLKGVKIRVPQVEITINSLKATGAAPTPIAYGESLLALQQGVVDAIWCTEDAAYTMGFYEVAKYLIELNSDFDSMYLYTNENFYQNLSDNNRAALEEAAQAAAEYYSGLAEEALATNLAKMKEAGIEVITLPEETVTAIFESCLPYYRELEANGEWSEGLLDKVLEIIENA